MRYFFLFVVITLSSACQKGIDPEISSSSNASTGTTPTTSTSVTKIKTYTEDITLPASGHSVTTYNLNYDANDRLVSFISASSPGDKIVYQYNSATSFTMDIYNANAVVIHAVNSLNSSLLVDSVFEYNNTKDTSTQKYIYNSSKQVITFIEYDYTKAKGAVLYNTTNYLYDNLGNLAKETDKFSVTTYDYYTNLATTVELIPPYFSHNNNLVKTTYSTSGGTTDTLNHTYTFDASNRLSTEKIVTSDGDVVIKTYTY